MVSMKEIATACGVSVATVSKALNDHKDIGGDTKAHIRQLAKEMGYFPNAQARALKTNRTHNIGVLFVDEAQSGLKIPEDISVAGYDGIRIGRHIEPQLTTIRQDTGSIGRTAAEKLINLIEKPKTTLPEQVIISGSVYPGKTVGPLESNN